LEANVLMKYRRLWHFAKNKKNLFHWSFKMIKTLFAISQNWMIISKSKNNTIYLYWQYWHSTAKTFVMIIENRLVTKWREVMETEALPVKCFKLLIKRSKEGCQEGHPAIKSLLISINASIMDSIRKICLNIWTYWHKIQVTSNAIMIVNTTTKTEL